jgi:hypothetical protein
MKNLQLPVLAYNTVANLRPELIGLAAWLGVSDIYTGDRAVILRWAAEHGTLAGAPGFGGEENRHVATRAHEEWLAFLAQLEAPAAKVDPIVFHRNGNGHVLPPVSGGAPFNPQSRDYDNMVGAGVDDSEDIAF